MIARVVLAAFVALGIIVHQASAAEIALRASGF